jgi:acetyl esterase/lipase
LGRRLAERGILVACIDYRNFPQGTIGDMVEDASQGIAFVCNNIASYGGDPERFITYNDIKLSNFSVAITKWFLPTYALLMR